MGEAEAREQTGVERGSEQGKEQQIQRERAGFRGSEEAARREREMARHKKGALRVRSVGTTGPPEEKAAGRFWSRAQFFAFNSKMTR